MQKIKSMRVHKSRNRKKLKLLVHPYKKIFFQVAYPSRTNKILPDAFFEIQRNKYSEFLKIFIK